MKRHLRMHATLVLIGGLAFTALAVAMLTVALRDRDRQSFEANARAAQDTVLDRVETSIALLRGAAGLFVSRAEDPSVAEFRSYMSQLTLRNRYPGILGIGYSRRVHPEQRAEIERILHRQGHSEFRIWPDHPRDEWHSIVFLEPLDARNLAALGYDMFSEPIRREAMARARDSGSPAASGIVELVQEIDERKQPGFLIYLPVYAGGSVPATVEERRERLRGFAYSPIRTTDFLSSAFTHETRPRVSMRVTHAGETGDETVLYERSSAIAPHDASAFLQASTEVAGQRWQFQFWPVESPVQVIVVPILIGLAGFGISAAWAILLWREDLARRKIQAALEREQAARSQAEHANRKKDEFLATLSHELRTPLNAIVGWGAVLRAGRLSEQESNTAMEAIERNARIQARLIEDLLDMNRIVSGKLSLDMHPLELVAIVDAALETVQAEAKLKDVALLQRVESAGLTVRADFARLQQVVWNLLSNAVKFTPSGGRVEVTLRACDGRAQLAVADTGEGIDPAYLAHIFDRFSQADGTTTRRHGGLGLGLAIVRELVALHGGEVRASSPGPGQGATFVVELPLFCASACAAPADAVKPWEAILEGVRVLVVDDEPEVQRLVQLVLAQRRGNVRCAQSAKEALQLIDTFAPDVLVSDIGMPDIDGNELLRRIRARSGGSPLPRAVALSAYARQEDRDEALRAGYEEYLVKPVQPERLTAVVAALAAGKERLSA